MLRIEDIDRPPYPFPSLQRDLPAGVRQCDCDGPIFPLSKTLPEQLWAACDERQQHAIAQRFAELHVDDLRDALLEAQRRCGEADRGASLHDGLWEYWTRFRDRALGALCRRGNFPRD
jgi:hypothetical protein